MKARLIINPISGTASKEGLDRFVADTLSRHGWEIETVLTRGRGDATRLAAEAADAGYDAVFAAGGDGTVNETAGALCNRSTALGIIPCGSGNGLARHLGIPVDVREGVDVIARHKPLAIDYATVDGRKFFCTFGVGFDAAVSEAFSHKKRRGKFTYLRSTIQTYTRFRPERYTITAGGETLTEEAFLVAVCNASQYGNNAYIAPRAVIDDGLLDVTIIHAGNPFSTALVGIDLLTGMIEKNVLIHTFRTPSLTIHRTDGGPVHLDGEPLVMGKSMDISCRHRALNVIAPPQTEEIKPFVTPATAMIKDFHIAVNKILRPKL